MIDAAAGTITLPVEPGTDLTTLDPTYAVVSGAVVSPDGPADYTSPVALTVTKGPDSRVWTVKAVEMRSPRAAGSLRRPQHRGVRRDLLHLRDHGRHSRLGRQGLLRLEVAPTW